MAQLFYKKTIHQQDECSCLDLPVYLGTMYWGITLKKRLTKFFRVSEPFAFNRGIRQHNITAGGIINLASLSDCWQTQDQITQDVVTETAALMGSK